ncbi:MAG: sigma-70 family RNA polymerase sigma factor [Leptolyngbyaceae cyanobacterium SM2_5_2]|nr:sigma-70 family RNA polymerase sigma factor [Leptolyngbyaceae cyanobacterium SM2_5_2]
MRLHPMVNAVNLPQFPECDHALVQSLQHLSDQELVTLFQRHPESGRYFTTIFCRYSPVVYSLIRHSARSPVQAEYLFALTWRHILHELGGVDTGQAETGGHRPSSFTLQNWIINVTALCINQVLVPEVEAIHYSLADASPPFWCYLEQALERLRPIDRLIVVMAMTFRWSEARIVAYLRAEGEQLSAADVRVRLGQAYQNLEETLPEDIREIYLAQLPQPDTLPSDDELLNDLFLEQLDGSQELGARSQESGARS